MRKNVLMGGAFMLLAIGMMFGVAQSIDAGRPFVSDALTLLVFSFAIKES